MTYTDMVNLSLNQVLMRSLNTSITALLPIALAARHRRRSSSGATTLQEFALALLIGLASGAYSSIFIASAAARRPQGARAPVPRRAPTHRGPRRGRPLAPMATAAVGAQRRRPAPTPSAGGADGRAGHGDAPASPRRAAQAVAGADPAAASQEDERR